jgi:hypothetical protein
MRATLPQPYIRSGNINGCVSRSQRLSITCLGILDSTVPCLRQRELHSTAALAVKPLHLKCTTKMPAKGALSHAPLKCPPIDPSYCRCHQGSNGISCTAGDSSSSNQPIKP